MNPSSYSFEFIIHVNAMVMTSNSKEDLIRKSQILKKKAGSEFYKACCSLESPKQGLVQETNGHGLSCSKVLHCYLPPFTNSSDSSYVSH